MGFFLSKPTEDDPRKADVVDDADVKRYFEGTHEMFLSPNGEAGLMTDFLSCKKSHNKYIEASLFSKNSVPPEHRDRDVVEFIKVCAQLTLRVSVVYTSPNRPQYAPGTNRPYPFYDIRGKNTLKCGSGRIYSALRYAEKDQKTCQCSKCLRSKSPSHVWWEVIIFTATHVVFDDLEARQSTCRLFYDSQDSPLVALDGMSTIADINKDRCWLICATCDVELVKKLKRCTRDFALLCERLYTKYSQSKRENNLCIIVSHPHGCCKQISIGEWFCRLDKGSGYSRYSYTTSTCRGTSGAWVYILGSDVWLYNGHVHSGTNKIGSNYSGDGRDYSIPRMEV